MWEYLGFASFAIAVIGAGIALFLADRLEGGQKVHVVVHFTGPGNQEQHFERWISLRFSQALIKKLRRAPELDYQVASAKA